MEGSLSRASDIMTLLEQLEQIENRLERSFRLGRFDTFNQLLSDRFVVLKKARQLPENEVFFERARQQSNRWNELLRKRVREHRQRQMQEKTIQGYGREVPKSGRMLNRSV
ncbi:hypothetical protein [Pontiella agarivorans]|uniref:Flagellar protein FliT n=1 Tax=Pontiella agarivorans TaxID=3038953 RepID=A0ABU5MST2_9BACT|nr:hypothetical protein [Pontiella agarivorans]MDZ8117263.1 hypothetical protein [Pontiella agarivorans]